MTQTRVEYLKNPKLKNPIFIEGLPGIGYIGRNVASYLIEELGAVKFATLHSHYFPPVVLLDENKTGEIRELKNEFYYWKAKKKNQRDMIILIGDSQSMDPKGHYEVVLEILKVATKCRSKEMVTIGGFGTGDLKDDNVEVFGAAVEPEVIKKFGKFGVRFKDTNIGQIIGASGLLITEGHRQGIKGVCLMGETSGMLLSDPKATEAVLNVLTKYLNVKLDMKKLEKRVKETEKVIEKIESLQKRLMGGGVKKQKPSDVGYIG